MNPNTILTEQSKASPLIVFFLWMLSVAALTASAKIQIPMVPVPITMQTVIVLSLPCIFGYKMGLGILTTYLMMGLAGAPVFAGPSAGPAYFFGPTGGYLAGFVIAAAFAYFLFSKIKMHSIFSLCLVMLAGHIVILFAGFLWLAYGLPSLGFSKAFLVGVTPFLTGSILKSIIAALLISHNSFDKIGG